MNTSILFHIRIIRKNLAKEWLKKKWKISILMSHQERGCRCVPRIMRISDPQTRRLVHLFHQRLNLALTKRPTALFCWIDKEHFNAAASPALFSAPVDAS
jgi:hypothetical protein